MSQAAEPRRAKLLDHLRDAIRARHYSRRTEDAYVDWIKRFIIFHGMRHPAEMGPPELTAFLSSLAVRRKVAPSTHNQALAARVPVVLSPNEVRRVLDGLDGTPRLMAATMYGTGIRLLECCRLRVKDVDFERRHIVVREGKGSKDRVTMLPDSLREPLGRNLDAVKAKHQSDLVRGAG